nr:unnamed protein product [Callosobruchus analis]
MSPSIDKIARPDNQSASSAAELSAIIQAMLYVQNNGAGTYLVCSDSLSCILSLQDNFSKDPMIQQINSLYFQLCCQSKNIRITYRPISMLPSYSKIFEKIMNIRIITHMTQTKQLADAQYEYYKKFINDEHNAFEDDFLPWVYSLTCEKHMIHFIVKYYWKNFIYMVLEENLFNGLNLIFIIENNMFRLRLYGNTTGKCFGSNLIYDTNILVKGDGIPDIKYKANEVFKSSKEWFTKNRLNNKTNRLPLKKNRANIGEREYLYIGDTHVKLTKAVKFQGLIVDNTLSWLEHLYILPQRYIDNDTIKSVYHATVESHIRYGIVMYGGCSPKRKLFVAQKRALRTILGMNMRDSCRGRFRYNRILTVSATFVQECIPSLRKNDTVFYNARPQTTYNIPYYHYKYPRHRLTQTEHSGYYSRIKMTTIHQEI